MATHAGEGPAIYPAVQERTAGATGSRLGRLAGHREQRGPSFHSPQGSSPALISFFRPTLCLFHFVPQETFRQKEIIFAKLRAKNSSAHPTKAEHTGQPASEFGKASPAQSRKGPEASAARPRVARAELSKQPALTFKPLPQKDARVIPATLCPLHLWGTYRHERFLPAPRAGRPPAGGWGLALHSFAVTLRCYFTVLIVGSHSE